MLKIITNIPLFVWPLFAVLLIGGLKARKTELVPLKALIMVPAVFFGWSLFSFFGGYGDNSLAIFLWILCLGLGLFTGFSHIQRLKPRCDKQKKMIEMPGSWIPLVLSMSVFFAKFSIGMMRGMLPHLDGSFLFLGLELFCTVILGVMIGRAAACFLRYRASAIESVKDCQ